MACAQNKLLLIFYLGFLFYIAYLRSYSKTAIFAEIYFYREVMSLTGRRCPNQRNSDQCFLATPTCLQSPLL